MISLSSINWRSVCINISNIESRKKKTQSSHCSSYTIYNRVIYLCVIKTHYMRYSFSGTQWIYPFHLLRKHANTRSRYSAWNTATTKAPPRRAFTRYQNAGRAEVFIKGVQVDVLYIYWCGAWMYIEEAHLLLVLLNMSGDVSSNRMSSFWLAPNVGTRFKCGCFRWCCISSFFSER